MHVDIIALFGLPCALDRGSDVDLQAGGGDQGDEGDENEDHRDGKVEHGPHFGSGFGAAVEGRTVSIDEREMRF